MGFTNQTQPTGYAVISCPDFKLQAVVRRVHTTSEPVALVDDTQRQSIILCRNEAAMRFGVETGMKTVQALARSPALQIERPSVPAETAASRLLLETALSWVPGIEETEDGMLTLDLSTQREGEWVDSARRLRGRLYDAGLEAVIGLGETPSLARIAAFAARQRGESFWQLVPERRLEMLDGLPLGVAEIGKELQDRLSLWGVPTLGAFARFSREAVAARLGDEGVELWLRLTGQIRRPLRFAKLEELFEAHEDFEHEVCDREPLLFVVNRFLDQLIVRVARTGRAATAVHVLLTFTNGTCHAHRLALPEPLLDHEILFHLVSGHFDALEWKAPVESLRLRFEPSDPVASQRLLFGAGLRNRFQFEDTMKRLRRLVGSERVGSPRRVNTHRPGAFELVPLPSEIEDAPKSGGPPVTGFTLCRFQGRVRTVVQWQSGRPHRIESRLVSGIVIGVAGPWHVGGDWWHLGKQWQRREWDVELVGKGVYRLVESDEECFIEGRYD
ncbi:MAG: DNA polymerase Y family protein [Verrucomicrobiales bacterium]|nr:DNA polymerase Y family protein [Verrucomicrobiales bacterium]